MLLKDTQLKHSGSDLNAAKNKKEVSSACINTQQMINKCLPSSIISPLFVRICCTSPLLYIASAAVHPPRQSTPALVSVYYNPMQQAARV